MNRRRANALVAGAIALLALGALPATAAASGGSGSIWVHPGESIQAAIDAASPGEHIHVAKGTYWENLLVTKGVWLVGHHATLRPPTKAVENQCSQGEAGQQIVTGICVFGQFDQSGNLQKSVDGVRISGFTVRGFSGDGVFAAGANGLTARNDTFRDNGGYGIFALHSSWTTYVGNRAHDNGDAGFYIGESQTAHARVQWNVSYRNTEGILFRDSLGGEIDHNRFWGNCVGVLVLDTGVPGAGGQVRVDRNKVTINNHLCPASDEAPAFGGIGIALVGANSTRVDHNRVEDNRAAAGSAIPGGGVVVVSGVFAGGADATNNVVSRNRLDGNRPYDLFSDNTGTGNRFSHNDCDRSNVGGC